MTRRRPHGHFRRRSWRGASHSGVAFTIHDSGGTLGASNFTSPALSYSISARHRTAAPLCSAEPWCLELSSRLARPPGKCSLTHPPPLSASDSEKKLVPPPAFAPQAQLTTEGEASRDPTPKRTALPAAPPV